jgi:hypothetical protein
LAGFGCARLYHCTWARFILMPAQKYPEKVPTLKSHAT